MRMSNGMTLVEVMIVVAIIAIFLGSVGGLLFSFPFSSRTAENFLIAARTHERAMTVMREELLQTSTDILNRKFWILDLDEDDLNKRKGLAVPGAKIRFRRFSKFDFEETASGSVGKCYYDIEVKFYRDPDTDFVMRCERQWGSVVWSEPQVIGSYCTDLTFTELPGCRIKITMTNEVGDPDRSYVGVYSNSVDVTPEN